MIAELINYNPSTGEIGRHVRFTFWKDTDKSISLQLPQAGGNLDLISYRASVEYLYGIYDDNWALLDLSLMDLDDRQFTVGANLDISSELVRVDNIAIDGNTLATYSTKLINEVPVNRIRWYFESAGSYTVALFADDYQQLAYYGRGGLDLPVSSPAN